MCPCERRSPAVPSSGTRALRPGCRLGRPGSPRIFSPIAQRPPEVKGKVRSSPGSVPGLNPDQPEGQAHGFHGDPGDHRFALVNEPMPQLLGHQIPAFAGGPLPLPERLHLLPAGVPGEAGPLPDLGLRLGLERRGWGRNGFRRPMSSRFPGSRRRHCARRPRNRCAPRDCRTGRGTPRRCPWPRAGFRGSGG